MTFWVGANRFGSSRSQIRSTPGLERRLETYRLHPMATPRLGITTSAEILDKFYKGHVERHRLRPSSRVTSTHMMDVPADHTMRQSLQRTERRTISGHHLSKQRRTRVTKLRASIPNRHTQRERQKAHSRVFLTPPADEAHLTRHPYNERLPTRGLLR